MEDTAPARKAIVMYSGGADSTLALKIMLEMGIECVALNVKTPFCSCTHGGCAGAIGDIILDNEIRVRTRYLAEAYMKMIANPKYGYGRGMNPCSDCRIMMLRAAREVMIEEGASFVVTGEVVGQRPNSQQMQQMRAIERDSGLSGRLLRPLSAKLLPPTWPEIAGLVDRRKFFDLQGRTRTRQLAMGRRFNLGELPGSGGGCVLTEPRYADKVRDLYAHSPDGVASIEDARLLRIGRHFRLSPAFKVVIGRDEDENQALERLIQPGDLLFYPNERTYGPLALARGDVSRADWPRIASLMLRYCDVPKEEEIKVDVFTDNEGPLPIAARPMDNEKVLEYLV